MKIVKADILSAMQDDRKVVVGHGCNCFHTMGAGIAGYLSKLYPIILDIDKNTHKGDIKKLGTTTSVQVNDNLKIYNCYTQYRPGADARISAIEQCLISMVHAEDKDTEFRLPQIGCGIGGLSWGDVKPLYENIFRERSLIVYYL
jgi:O-acetyl-ADP-ribose deacetylase (regulator of RNase III)